MLLILLVIQTAVFYKGYQFFWPKLNVIIETTVLRAPSMLKLGIETAVFGIGIAFRVIGVLLLLFIPTWIGLISFMGRRTTDSQYVDITPDGIVVTSPAEKLFIPAGKITGMSYSRVLKRLTIKTGRRKVRIKKVVEGYRKPEKIGLGKWLAGKAPARSEVKTSMLALKGEVEGIIERQAL